jgi:membrane fusion protein (multidrug efflux system)
MTSIHRKWLLPLVAIIALLLIIAWMAGSFRDKIEPGLQALEATATGESWPVPRVEVAVTEPVPASIGARQATTISSRTLARITHITVRAGDTVSQGQMLIELERSDLQARLAQASEQVNAVGARFKEAQQSLKRAQQLHTQNLVAVAVLDEARSNHDALNAELATARQTVKEAEVAISFTEIRSPIDGRVVERYAEPGDTASPGDKLLSLYNPLSLRIEAAVRETIALPLELGQALEVEIPSLDKTLPAQIEELVPAADPASRSFMVRARVEYDGQLLPGMYARLLVPAGRESLLLVPRDLVTEYGQLDIVWVIEDGRTDRRFIRAGREVSPGMIEIISGLDEGDRLLPPPL